MSTTVQTTHDQIYMYSATSKSQNPTEPSSPPSVSHCNHNTPQPSTNTSHYPRLHFFGLRHPSLPPTGTALSPENPYVQPLPLTLGLTTTSVTLIHARRFNPFLPHQDPVHTILSSSAPLFVPALEPLQPAGIKDPDVLDREVYFRGNPDALDILTVLSHDRILQTGKDDWYRVCVKTWACAKMCGGCGRWEQLVKRVCRKDEKGKRREGEGGLRYRRWGMCAGCGKVWYCGWECKRADWERHRDECGWRPPLSQDGGCEPGSEREILVHLNGVMKGGRQSVGEYAAGEATEM